jgi:hypothetical protein
VIVRPKDIPLRPCDRDAGRSIVGINYPWGRLRNPTSPNYGGSAADWDFGSLGGVRSPPGTPTWKSSSSPNLRDDLEAYARLNFRLVRWWIYSSGLTLPVNPLLPTARVPLSAPDYYRPFGARPTAADLRGPTWAAAVSGILGDVALALRTFRQFNAAQDAASRSYRKIYLVPCLFNFAFFSATAAVNYVATSRTAMFVEPLSRGWAAPDHRGFRWGILDSPTEAIEVLVRPMVQLFRIYGDVVYAIDLINEMDQIENEFPKETTPQGNWRDRNALPDRMREKLANFLKLCIEEVEETGVIVAGSGSGVYPVMNNVRSAMTAAGELARFAEFNTASSSYSASHEFRPLPASISFSSFDGFRSYYQYFSAAPAKHPSMPQVHFYARDAAAYGHLGDGSNGVLPPPPVGSGSLPAVNEALPWVPAPEIGTLYAPGAPERSTPWLEPVNVITAQMPRDSVDPSRRVILGEISINPLSDPWPDLAGGDDMTARLITCQSRGYRVVMIWADIRAAAPGIAGQEPFERDVASDIRLARGMGGQPRPELRAGVLDPAFRRAVINYFQPRRPHR